MSSPERSLRRDEDDRGAPGASAEREYWRRRRDREARTRARHPWIGGLLLAVGDEPHHEAAFRRGARGERTAALWLDRHTARGPAQVLCDRRMPRGRGNIDLLAIAPSGVFVIDVKAHGGRVAVERRLFAAPRMSIRGRDRTSLLDGLDRQIEAVRSVLSDGYAELPVQGVLCFTAVDLPRLRTLQLRDHLLLGLRPLAERLNADGPLDARAIDAVARRLAAKLGPA